MAAARHYQASTRRTPQRLTAQRMGHTSGRVDIAQISEGNVRSKTSVSARNGWDRADTEDRAGLTSAGQRRRMRRGAKTGDSSSCT
eukprot:3461969-Rhodomonas_salina.2